MALDTNSEGSRAIPLALHTRVSQRLRVSPRQRSILLGSLLGDAYLSQRGQIFIDHAMSQEAYVKWKFKELSSLAYDSLSVVRRRDRRTDRETKSCRFILRQYFRPWRQYFYASGRKFLSRSALQMLDGLSLAVWYMDDGHFDRRRYTCEIATDSYPKSELYQCCGVLSHRFHIDFQINSKGRLYADRHASQLFMRLIRPFVIPEMEYKIALTL